MGFPEDLKAWRQKQGLTQAEAAELFQLTETGYGNWEAGRKAPRGLLRTRVLEILRDDGSGAAHRELARFTFELGANVATLTVRGKRLDPEDFDRFKGAVGRLQALGRPDSSPEKTVRAKKRPAAPRRKRGVAGGAAKTKPKGADESFPMLRKVISGGQAGADRAGLDFALEVGLEHGGYVPKRRKAEDGRIDERYRLIELPSASYPTRTKRNVRESDGTAIFSLRAELSGGSALTLAYARSVKKPVIHLHATNQNEVNLTDQLKGFIASNRIETLNVAGPRESKEPGVYEFTLGLLRRYWQERQGQKP